MSNHQPFARTHSCRISDAVTYCGFRAVVMENELLRVVVLPDKGAEIYSLVYKPHDMDVLFKRGQLHLPQAYPNALSNSEDGFIHSYFGGWQELFPSGGSACRVRNAFIGTHGEVLMLPWSWQILEDRAGRVSVRFQVRTRQMPFLLQRTMSLETGSPVLIIKETLTNESREELPYMWGHHPAFGAPFLDGSCVLDAPAARVEVQQGDDSECCRLPAGANGEWSRMAGRDGKIIDLRWIPAPESRTRDMFYLTGLNEGWCALTNRNLGFGVGMAWDVEMFPVLWVWQELCGSSGYPWFSETYAMGLEPFTAYSTESPGGLARVIEAGQERRLAAGAQISTGLRMVCYQAVEEQAVERISQEGVVFYKTMR